MHHHALVGADSRSRCRRPESALRAGFELAACRRSQGCSEAVGQRLGDQHLPPPEAPRQIARASADYQRVGRAIRGSSTSMPITIIGPTALRARDVAVQPRALDARRCRDQLDDQLGSAAAHRCGCPNKPGAETYTSARSWSRASWTTVWRKAADHQADADRDRDGDHQRGDRHRGAAQRRDDIARGHAAQQPERRPPSGRSAASAAA